MVEPFPLDGATGPAGATGPPGITGPAYGATGPISAEYEAALDRIERTQAKMDRAWSIYTHTLFFLFGVIFALAMLVLVLWLG